MGHHANLVVAVLGGGGVLTQNSGLDENVPQRLWHFRTHPPGGSDAGGDPTAAGEISEL